MPADELLCLHVIQSAMGATGIEPMTSTVSNLLARSDAVLPDALEYMPAISFGASRTRG